MTNSNDQCVAAIQTIVSRVGAYIRRRMANHTLRAISGIATVSNAPFESGSMGKTPYKVYCDHPAQAEGPGRYHHSKYPLLMRRALLAAPLAALLFASPTTAAAQPWVTAPASDNAELISQLFWFTLVLATIVFVLVEGLLIYSSLRFRRRLPLPAHEPPQIHGNTRLEVMWAAVPALILVGLFGITVSRLGDISQIPSNDPNVLRIGVTGRQFQWEFDYGNSIKSTNELHIPVGQPLIFDVTSADVIHSFWVPDLYGKIDANPGRVNRITFRARTEGEFRGVCAELCGAGHSGMLFRVQAQSQSDFQQWLQQQQAGGAPGQPAAPGAPGAPAAPAPQPGAPTAP